MDIKQMPYSLLHSHGNKYWVVDSSGRKYEHKPIPLQRAKKQIIALHINTLHGGGMFPSLSILQEIAHQSYLKNPESVKEWELVDSTPTLKFYQNGDTIIVGIRGTHVGDVHDFKADASIPFNQLKNSVRYQTDLKYLTDFITNNPATYYGTGHSLGGAILDLFIDNGLVEQGVSFNPAVETRNFYSKKSTKNKRIYTSCDPLYNIMGRFTYDAEVIPSDNKGIKNCHEIKQFSEIYPLKGGNFFTNQAYQIIDKANKMLQAWGVPEDVIRDFLDGTKELIKKNLDSVGPSRARLFGLIPENTERVQKKTNFIANLQSVVDNDVHNIITQHLANVKAERIREIGIREAEAKRVQDAGLLQLAQAHARDEAIRDIQRQIAENVARETFAPLQPRRDTPGSVPPTGEETLDGGKLKHIKKYLKGMGLRATKKNIKHALSACDAEGVVF